MIFNQYKFSFWQELQESQANIRNLNKLSHRHRCIATPSIEEIRVREQTFVNDAIITERKRTKYKDIIPVYDASRDNHCLGYFKRPDVKHLVSITCTPTGSFGYDSKIKSPRRQKLRASAPWLQVAKPKLQIYLFFYFISLTTECTFCCSICTFKLHVPMYIP